ncbi:MAG TPA: hypothetical protein VN876_03055 [Gemmatimonadaceae bacterium]|nr:hypothetical protein [Gemmatimonadaceae bacterium]
MTSGPRIVTALATEEHADAVAAFYREVWNPAATAESVVTATRRSAARNVAAPGVPTPAALVLVGNRVVGYCGSIPQLLWDGVRERPAYWVKGLMVLPEYRNGPVGYLVVKELSRHLDCSTILTVAPAARRLFSALGYTDLGAVTNWTRPLRPSVMAERLDLDALGLSRLPKWVGVGVSAARRTGIAGLAAKLAGLGLDVASGLARLPAAHLDTAGLGAPPRAELDELWIAARKNLTASPVRDGAYLESRFGNGAEQEQGEEKGEEQQRNPYTFVTTRDRGCLLGVAVVRGPRATSDARLSGIRVATVSEFVFPVDRADAGLATLGAIERVARAAGADAVTCMTSHPILCALLRRQGYLRLAGNVHFFLRDVSGLDRFRTDLGAWWLGRGDGESDTSF